MDTLLHSMGAAVELLAEQRGAQHGLAALPWANHMALAPQHRGACRDTHSSAWARCLPAPCPAGMGSGTTTAGASRLPTFLASPCPCLLP